MPYKYSFNTPDEIRENYEHGLVGAIHDPAGMHELRASNNKRFGSNKAQIGHLAGYGDDKIVLNYKAAMQLDEKLYLERQDDSDCVSFATRNGSQTSASVEIVVKKEAELFIARFATENIYGDRGHSGGGASCPRLAKYVNTKGGILLRQNYPDLGIDLTTYNSRIGVRWGGRGVPDNVNQEAAKHQIKRIIFPKSVQEVKDLTAAGYSGAACSGMAFSKNRDSNGIANQQGSWAHAMTMNAGDDSGTRLSEYLVCISNSWGIWNGGPKAHEQPDGSFWIRESILKRYLSGGGVVFFSQFDGWPGIIPTTGYDYSFT